MAESPATAEQSGQPGAAQGQGQGQAPAKTHPYNAASTQRESVLRGFSEQKHAILQAVAEQREAMLDPIREVNARNAHMQSGNTPGPAPKAAPGPDMTSGLGKRVLGPRGTNAGGSVMADQSQVMAEIVATIRTLVADEVRKQLVLLMDQADAQMKAQKQESQVS